MNTQTPESSASLEKLAFTKKELCESLGLCPVTLWRLEKRGLLKPVPGIRHKLYARREGKRFLAGTSR